VQEFAKFVCPVPHGFQAFPESGRVGEKLGVVVSDGIGTRGTEGHNGISPLEDLQEMEG
jgi:hypothetical protein